jgi:ComF family protein
MQARKAANIFIDFFLPRFCLSCNSKLNFNQQVICDGCLSSIQRADKLRLEFEFDKKFSSEKIIDGFTSAFVFQSEGSLQSLLHELKYRMRFRVGNLLGNILAEEVNEQIKNWKVDFIIPMPIHKLRKAERGYNQTDHIAKTFGRILSIPVKKKIVKRIKFTRSQTKLNIDERKENMRGAFKVTADKEVKSKVILILDDVITTGATVTEAGRVLKEKGASKVYACSVAIAD